MDYVTRRLLTKWMRDVETVMREMLFAISQGTPMPTDAEAFTTIRHGLNNMRETCREVANNE